MSAISTLPVIIIIILYSAALLFILCYSIAQAWLVIQYLVFKKGYEARRQPPKKFDELPRVTIQLPIYNEKYVAERLIDCVARLDYPLDKIEIQVLDDSTDETVALIAAKVALLQEKISIHHIRRGNRQGFKAGALKAGLETATGEFIAIFDADFLPPTNFLYQTIPYFIDDTIGMVQTKWTWLNKSYSLLTRLQAFALDAHFSIEQVGRNIQQGFINFNGTAGVWRKACILDAGNWHADTLTEDLDLSYRAQLKDWEFIYLEHQGSPSELPPVMSAVKTQQYRWNKGGAETARKHLRNVIRSKKPLLVKWQGVVHLLTSGVFLSAFICASLSVPMVWIRHGYPQYAPVLALANYCFASFLILGIMYLVASLAQNPDKQQAVLSYLLTLPVFLTLSMGLTLHNAIAVLEGYAGKKTPFTRTPKFNLLRPQDGWTANHYLRKGLNKGTFAEAFMMLYFVAGILLAFRLHDFTLLPFHVLLALGYGGVIFYTLKG